MERYLYETHLHTRQASACGKVDAAQMVHLYKDAGYTGVVITDHFLGGNTAIAKDLPWEEWVEGFCSGYEQAKAEGDKIGLQVFFGWESGFRGTEFLIYGLDKQWLLEHPQIKGCTVEQQYDLVHEGGGIVIHAHPYRVRPYIKEVRLFPEHVDAVEGYNAAHSSINSVSADIPLFNEQAVAYAKEHGLPMTAGSDQHGTNMFGGGMVFSRKMEDIQDFCRAILNAEAVEFLDGTQPLCK